MLRRIEGVRPPNAAYADARATPGSRSVSYSLAPLPLIVVTTYRAQKAHGTTTFRLFARALHFVRLRFGPDGFFFVLPVLVSTM